MFTRSELEILEQLLKDRVDAIKVSSLIHEEKRRLIMDYSKLLSKLRHPLTRNVLLGREAS